MPILLVFTYYTYYTKIIDSPLLGSRVSGFSRSGFEFALNVKVALLSPFQVGWELLRALWAGLGERENSEAGEVVF